MEREVIGDKLDILRTTEKEQLEGELLNLMSFFNKSKEEIQKEWHPWKKLDFEHWQNRNYGDFGSTKFIYSSNLYINDNNDILALNEESATRYVYNYLSTEMFRNLVDREKFREEFESLVSNDPFEMLAKDFRWYHNTLSRKGFWDYIHPKTNLSIDGYGGDMYLLIRNPLKEVEVDTYVIEGCDRIIILPGLNDHGFPNMKKLEG